MTLKELMVKQAFLDQIIIDNKNLSSVSKEEMIGKKICALQSEVNELADEIKFYKYWSKKGPDYGNAKKEFIDILHFVLSLGNDLFKDDKEIERYYHNKLEENIKRQENDY